MPYGSHGQHAHICPAARVAPRAPVAVRAWHSSRHAPRHRPRFYEHAPNDAWLWERLLEMSAAGVAYDPDASVLWACLASHAALKDDVALALLSNREVKRVLVHLASLAQGGDADAPLDGTHAVRPNDAAGVAGRAEPSPPDASPWASPAVGSGAAAGGSLAGVAWRSAGAEELEAAYAKLALHRLAQSAATAAGRGGLSDELRLEIEEPFVEEYMHYETPPLPRLPPPHLFWPPAYEMLAGSVLDVFGCGFGGLLWGTLAGAMASARARRPMWRTALLTAGGAMLFEGLMQAKGLAFRKWRTLGRPDASPVSPPAHGNVLALALTTSADIGLSCTLLYLLVQPSRAPFAFGGWVAGRALSLSQDVSIELYESAE